MRERRVVMGGVGWVVLRLWYGQQPVGTRDIGAAGGFGEQAVVADAVEALRQYVKEEAADELVSPAPEPVKGTGNA